MNKAKHTPGPWKAGDDPIYVEIPHTKAGIQWVRVIEANARLIADSPTMLGLLKTGVREVADAGKDAPESLRFWSERAQEIINHIEEG